MQEGLEDYCDLKDLRKAKFDPKEEEDFKRVRGGAVNLLTYSEKRYKFYMFAGSIYKTEPAKEQYTVKSFLQY